MLNILKNGFGGRTLNWAFGLVAVAGLCGVVAIYWLTWIPGYGLTRMIPIGWEFEHRGIPVYRSIPKIVESRWGFDGQLYAEISLDPLLRNPGMKTAIDSPAYRSHRILLSWLAWLGGLGRPGWVLNVYAALNGAFWIGYAAILMVLFRPCGWAGVAGFAAMAFTGGVVESMHASLTDFPAFVLLTLAAMWGGAGGGVVLGLSGLTREADLLGYLGLVRFRGPWRESVRRNLLVGVLAGLPVLLWFIYVECRFPGKESMLGGNIDWPLHAIFLRLGEAVRSGRLDLRDWNTRATEMHALLTIVGLLTQCLYLVTHPKPDNRLWRVGAVFVPYFLCVSSNVWTGASYFTVTRHALPITLAFNLVLAMRPGRSWVVWFLLGNAFVPAGVRDFVHFAMITPTHAECVVEAPDQMRRQVSGEYASGWSGAEWRIGKTWRWATGRTADLELTNRAGEPVEMRLRFRTHSPIARDLRVAVDGKTVWLGRLDPEPKSLAVLTTSFVLPPGRTRVRFETSQGPALPSSGDPRSLSFSIDDLRLVAAGAP